MTESAKADDGVGATRVEALHYRSMRYLAQTLGPFHVLVGPNASGKSNFLDVLAFLGDVLNTDLGTALVGEDRLDIPLRATDGRDLLWSGPADHRGQPRRSFELAVEMAIPEHLRRRNSICSLCRYEVEVSVAGEPRFVSETLWLKPPSDPSHNTRGSGRDFPHSPRPPAHIASRTGTRTPEGWEKVLSRGREAERVNYRAETSGWTAPFQITASKSALANLPADHALFPVALWFREMLQSVQRVVLSGEAMRRPCPPVRRHEYLPDGSNLPHVVHRLAGASPDQHELWVKHIGEVLPDITGISTRERDDDRHRYLVLEHTDGRETPSWLVSDGTLRLLALTLLAYLPDVRGLYLIEEPENGLHPRAIETVFQSLSSVYGAQVLLTTHSPLVARLTEAEWLLCVARDDRRGTDAVRGTEHPLLRDWQGSADIGTLLASGVLG